MIEKLLTEIGLSSKESQIYLTLLRYGLQSISFLASKAHLNRGTAYVILHSLLQKGLVVKSTKAKVQYFSPVSPELLPRYLENREQELKIQKEKVQEAMGQFLAIQNPHTAKPKIELFDGVAGARLVLEDSLSAKEKTLKAFLSIGDLAEFVGPEFFNSYTDRRVTKRYSLHVIRTLEKDKIAFTTDKFAKRYVSTKKEKREVRYLTDDLAFPISIYLYDHKLAIISSKEENFALIIQSKELANMQKKIFDFLWGILKKNK